MDRRSLARNIIFILLLVALISLAFSFEVFWKITLVILGFGSIIFVHELGHFVAAKATGVRVHRFYLGFCPTIEIPAGEYRFLWIGPKFRFPGFSWQMKVFSIKYGETEYGVGLLPLGGFVHMAGEPGSEEEMGGKPTDPRDFNAKPAWARATILVSGAFMNAVFAFVFFIVAFMVGVDFISPEVGMVLPAIPIVGDDGNTTTVVGPAWEAGIRSGDRIVSVNGNEYTEFQEIATEIALLGEGQTVEVGIERPTDEGIERMTMTMKPVPSPRGFQIGVAPKQSLKIGKFVKGSHAAGQDIELGATLRSMTFGNETVELTDPDVLRSGIYDRVGQTGSFILTGRAGKEIKAKIEVARASGPNDWRLGFVEGGELTVIGRTRSAPEEVGKNFPRGAVLADVTVTDAEGRRVTKKAFSELGLVKFIENASGDIEFTLLDRGRKLQVAVESDKFRKVYLANLALAAVSPEKKGKTTPKGVVVGYIESGSALAESGVGVGDTIVELKGKAINGFIDAMETIQGSKGREMSLAYLEAATGTRRTVKITPKRPTGGTLGVIFEPDMFTFSVSGPMEACGLGISRTWLWCKRIFLIIRSLFTGSVEAKNLAGPVGILNIMYLIAKYGIGKYLYILGLICINLAIINLLPIPLMDGGHLTFLAIETVIRRPVPLKYQSAAAWVGLVLILSLLLFTTFWDFKRLFSY
ncbi:MAG: site-2 protease family protein [Planctomycetota bacterium]|jgi:regulator of sigma E protease